MGKNGASMLIHSFLIESSSKLLVTRTGIKARTSLISGLWFLWPIYMFFEMRFDLGTLDSGERSMPFGLLVCLTHGGRNRSTHDQWKPKILDKLSLPPPHLPGSIWYKLLFPWLWELCRGRTIWPCVRIIWLDVGFPRILDFFKCPGIWHRSCQGYENALNLTKTCWKPGNVQSKTGDPLVKLQGKQVILSNMSLEM